MDPLEAQARAIIAAALILRGAVEIPTLPSPGQRLPDSAGVRLRELTDYVYFRDNVAGLQREWWYHRKGCKTWFVAERDTRTNEVLRTLIPAPTGVAAPQ